MASIKKNFAYQSIYQIFAMILPLITSPYIARVLGAEQIGIYSYTYSIAYYFMMIALLGIANYGNKEIASVRDNKDKLNQKFSEIMKVHVLFSVFAVILYLGYSFTFGSNQLIYSLIQGFWVLSSVFDISWFYFGIEKFKLTVTTNTIIKILMTATIFLFVKSTTDLWIYMFIMSFGTFLSQFILWFHIKKYVKFVKTEKEYVKKHVKPLLILFIPYLAVSLYKYMDKIMLGMISEKAQVGFYENAERVTSIPVSVVNSFGIVMLSKMSFLIGKEEDKKINRYISLSMEFVMCLASAMAFGLAAIAENFSIVFWGKEFVLSGTIIQMLSSTILFLSFANVLRTQFLIPRGLNKEFTISIIIGAITNIIINALLIPRLGAIGATIGTIFAEGSVCISQAFAVRKELPILLYLKNSIFFIFIGIIMYAIVNTVGKILGTSIPILLVQICIGVVVYTIPVIIYFIIRKNEIVLKEIENLKNKFKRNTETT